MDGEDSGTPMMRTLDDARGQAAMLLVESLIHGLIERQILTVGDALEIIGTAMEVQAEVVEAADGAGGTMRQSYSLLAAMAGSLMHDANLATDEGTG